MSYKHFTLNERKFLQELLDEGKSIRAIASFLGRSPSSVSREIKRNKPTARPSKKPTNRYRYNRWGAHNKSIIRRREKNYTVLKQGSDEWNFIVDKLNLFWPPETISRKWKEFYPEHKNLCISTIYRYVKNKVFPEIKPKTHLRRKGKRIQTRNANYNTIHPVRTIPQWPSEIVKRETVGHFEGDTVYGATGKGLIVTAVDRKSRYLVAALIPNRNATLTRKAICEMFKGITVKSLSLDNGSEFSEFRAIEEELDTLVYFAEPHKPWQRGTNENTNDILRFFFPKGFNFHSITQEDLDRVVRLINNRPRKCLGWRTPAEVFFEESVALT